MKTREFRERLLVAMTLVARRNNLGDFLQPSEVADEFGLVRLPGQLRLAIDHLARGGFINTSAEIGGGDEGGLTSRLTNYGLEEAEDYLDDHPEYKNPIVGELAPASNRYVSFSDNEIGDIKNELEKLANAVKSSNENSEDEKLIALSEIAAFEATIIQSRVATDLIERFVSRIIKWIRDKFGEALVSAITGAIVLKLLPVLNSGG